MNSRRSLYDAGYEPTGALPLPSVAALVIIAWRHAVRPDALGARMSQQFSMFDLWQPVLVRLPVDPYGSVVQGPPDETLTLLERKPCIGWLSEQPPNAPLQSHRHI